ncbi:hypothetical protein [Bacillus sp. 3255]|uniref:hypothetical protein n=1 Tax=Bacillus sp. 3255 TaxID=2817904 RepID=UPI0028673E76|nr:hypothetical protein [Bacillus sp. 3255]MDR6884867.1 hypothetical protein [Bacillus sp. 3255]
MERKIQDLYQEIGVYCPFELAENQGINLDYYYLGTDTCGLYLDLEGYQIILNTAMDIGKQVEAMHLLIAHHNSTSRGIEKKVSRKELSRLNKIVRDIHKLASKGLRVSAS